MSTREFFYFASIFFLIFGWKVTPIIDVSLLTAALWSVVVGTKVVLGGRKAMLDLPQEFWVISAMLASLLVYVMGLSIVLGLPSTQWILRTARAAIVWAGAITLVWTYAQSRAIDWHRRIVALTLAAITAHAVLVIAMYMSQDIANFVYGLTNAADHVDWYILDQGVRIPGLTYGLASTSVLYCFAFFASLYLAATSVSIWAKIIACAALVPNLWACMVTARSGIILALLLIPAVLLSSSRTVSIKSISKAICLFACFFATFSGLYFFLSYILPPNKYVGYTSKHLEEIFLFFLNGGQTRTTELLADMLFLPSNWKETLFGNSLTGREPSAYVSSDIGYVLSVFGIGAVGTAINMAIYLYGLVVAVREFLNKGRYWQLGVLNAAALVAVLILNGKEMMLLTRNAWSAQVILLAVLILARHQAAGVAPSQRKLEQPASAFHASRTQPGSQASRGEAAG